MYNKLRSDTRDFLMNAPWESLNLDDSSVKLSKKNNAKDWFDLFIVYTKIDRSGLA